MGIVEVVHQRVDGQIRDRPVNPFESADRDGVGVGERPVQVPGGGIDLVDIEREGDDGTPSVRYSGAAALAKSSGITVKSAEIFMSPVSRMSVTCGTRLQATPRATADRPQQATVPRRGLSDGGRWRKESQSGRPVTTGGLTGDQAECLRRIITTLTPTASSIKPRPAERADGGAGLRDTVAPCRRRRSCRFRRP